MERKLIFSTLMIVIFIITMIFLTPLLPSLYNQTSINILKISKAYPNLTFVDATDMKQMGDKMYIGTQDGHIYTFDHITNVSTYEEYLDIEGRVESGGEMGLLGFAFHPNYEENHLVLVDYTIKIDGDLYTRISSFEEISNKLDPNTEFILMQIHQPYNNHNAGQIIFDSDGYLLITLGDGGSAGDPQNNAQNLKSLLGSILRVEYTGIGNYSIPEDNPFKGNTEGYYEEIYAFGLRNPWRMSLDKSTGLIWIGEVGQNSFEEVNILQAGGNYGWNAKEGYECYNEVPCNDLNLIDPVFVYDHSLGISITGGFVYHGNEMAEYKGVYFFGDYGSGRIWTLEEKNGEYVDALIGQYSYRIVSFAQDNDGELYILTRSDNYIYKLGYD
ncbi:MAG: PQQ-dependent sugar dehydrogenase [Candidatus Heimdallarchaeota archaeon]|nr:PQQ-dependent sugar dehydrogenase [Candidatus Heimdallarchaeota archaeon]